MPQLPYDMPSDSAKRHSAGLTDGPDRAGARAMLKAVGFTDQDLAKPVVIGKDEFRKVGIHLGLQFQGT